MAKVKVFSSEIQQMTDVEGNFTTWGELKNELVKKGINVNNMKATCRETATSFEADNAVLPVGQGKDMYNNPNGFDFTLFLNPIQTKSGL